MNDITNTANKLSCTIKALNRKTAALKELFTNSIFRQSIILICLCLILAILLTPQIHFFQQKYKVGDIVAKDVKADRDFLVQDRAATEQRRREAVREAISVYDYDTDIVPALRTNLTKAFMQAARVMHRTTQDGSSAERGKLFLQTKRIFEKVLGITLTNDEINVLTRYRFSPPLVDKVIQLITSLYSTEFITSGTFLERDLEKGIIIRDVKTGIEEERHSLPSIRHINDIPMPLQKKADTILSQEAPDVRAVIVSLARQLIQPNLSFNRDATERKKQVMVEGIKPVFLQVQKNEMMLRKGERITRADEEVIGAYYLIKGGKGFPKLSVFFGTFLAVAFIFLVLYYPARTWLRSGRENVDVVFLSVTAILQIVLVKAGIFISDALNSAFTFIPGEAYVYATPFTLGAMLVGVMINRNVALIFALASSLLVPFLFQADVSMALYSFLGGAVASSCIVHYRKPSAFFKVGFFVGIVNGATIIIFSLLGEDALSLVTLAKFFMGLMGGIISGIIVAGVTPLFESLFGYTTDVKLLELASLNQPVFQRMILEAPGTYHHSIIVASLVEAAAESIGANSLLSKVSAYYHDIGKMKKPLYFIENQQNGENRHEKLSPKMSSLVIISHVKDGCELANSIKLGPEITNIVREHHGTSLVSYFYEKAKKDRDPSIRSLPESDFRYPGPKPQTREAGLVLLGDVIEASSRSLYDPTPSRIKNLVHERIEKIFTDGQLDECELTLRDLSNIAESFVRILNGIFHHRIDYPEPVVRDLHERRKGSYDYLYKKQPEKGKGRLPASAAGSE